MTKKRSPVLPAELAACLERIGSRLASGRDISLELEAALPQLWALPPGSIAKAEHEIVDACGLYRYAKVGVTLSDLLHLTPARMGVLDRYDDLKYLFIFHRNGNLREAALRKIDGNLPTAFAFVSVAWRLNDWVPPVRRAAEQCANRTFPKTDATVVAKAAIPLLSRKSSWSRWKSEREILDASFARVDVVEKVVTILKQQATGPLASVLREALKNENFDPYLLELATGAIQPSVRAVALDTLANSKATWAAGFEWQWVEKPLGIRRKKTVFEHRPVNYSHSVIDLIKTGLKDRSGFVRKTAMTALIQHRVDCPETKELAQQHVDDKSRPVRERAKFLLKPI